MPAENVNRQTTGLTHPGAQEKTPRAVALVSHAGGNVNRQRPASRTQAPKKKRPVVSRWSPMPAENVNFQRPASRTQAPKERRSVVSRWPILSFIVTDIALAVAAYVTSLVAPLGSNAAASLGWTIAFISGVVSVLAARGAYSRHLRVDLIDDLRSVIAAVLLAAMTFISARVLLTGDAEVARQMLGLSIYTVSFLAVGRILLAVGVRRTYRRHRIARPTLIFGAGLVGNLTARRLLADHRLRLDPVGFLEDAPLEPPEQPGVLPVLGGATDLDRVVAEHGIEHMIVAYSRNSYQLMLSVVRRCWELGVSVSLVPRLYELQRDRATVARLGGLPLISVASPPSSNFAISLKYGLDRVIAACLLTAIAPLMAAIALAIKVSTGGPVLFSQPRVGRDGRHFRMWKFRTMTGTPESDGQANAEWVEAVMRGELRSASGDVATPFGGDRTTPLGYWLRRLGLDELPQLWNVLRGEMSMIGPRPEQVAYVEKFEHGVYRYRDRQRVKSGMTGWAQVNGLRGDTSLEDRVEWDNYYIENWSPWLDLKILLMTVAVLCRGQVAAVRSGRSEPEPSAALHRRGKGDDREPLPSSRAT
jgi:exopolysaccharide biosynthesis polyprenyl glycosylphosphotransferase